MLICFHEGCSTFSFLWEAVGFLLYISQQIHWDSQTLGVFSGDFRFSLLSPSFPFPFLKFSKDSCLKAIPQTLPPFLWLLSYTLVFLLTNPCLLPSMPFHITVFMKTGLMTINLGQEQTWKLEYFYKFQYIISVTVDTIRMAQGKEQNKIRDQRPIILKEFHEFKGRVKFDASSVFFLKKL